jgi:ABC-2 type transport system ATP-binding protein
VPISVSVEHVAKAYPIQRGWGQFFAPNGRRTALTDVSFSVEHGECFGLVGLNGAGKTTLLKLVSTLLRPDAGSVTVMGFDAVADANRVRRQVGFCSANDRSFYGRLSVIENLRFFGRLQQISELTLAARVGILCEKLALADRLRVPFEALSTGQKQRLALVRALLNDPPVVVLDEPTRALDPIGATRFRMFVKDELVRDEGKTVLLATNLLEEARNVCNRVAVLHAHRIVAVGAPSRPMPLPVPCTP